MENEGSPSPKPVEVRMLKNGPIRIRGIFTVRESSGKITQGEQELLICSCGGSANKPWCDCTHKMNGNKTP